MPKIDLPFGPYHPALGEPEYFQIITDGEIIEMVDFDLGYNYREMEKKVLTFSWPKAVTFLGRICGICSSAHTQAFTIAVEEINNIKVSRKANWLRMFGAELERISSHLLWLGLMGEMAGFEPIFYLSWGAREHVLNMLEKFGGRRIHYQYMAYGGVHTSITDKNSANHEIKELTKKFKDLQEILTSNEGLAQKFKKVGVISKQDVQDFGLAGPTARGSHVLTDVRKDMPYLAYEEIGVHIHRRKGGDTYARMLVRLDEVGESIKLLDEIVNNLPGGRLSTVNGFRESKIGEASQMVEAPRGENFHHVIAGKFTPSFVRVRPPTFANLSIIPKILKGLTVSDVPVIINSIDPCFACTDRVVVIERSDKSIKEVQL